MEPTTPYLFDNDVQEFIPTSEQYYRRVTHASAKVMKQMGIGGPSADFRKKLIDVRANGQDSCYAGSGIPDEGTWILDGGTTQHATNDINDFVKSSIVDCNVDVHTGAGRTVVT